MKRLFKKSLWVIPAALLLMICFKGGIALAQTGFQPPTILPAEDIDIGGRGGVCVGLATMIRTGNIHLNNIPCFIKYFTQTLVALAGTLSVVFVMIGGYRYIIGGEENQAEAKKTITYALIGLAVALLAWVIIDLVLQVTTE